MEVLFCLFRLPSRILDQSPYELFFSRYQINHGTLRVSDESNGMDATDSNRVRDLKLAVSQVRASGPYDERKVVGYMKMLPIIHTHSDEQPGSCVRFIGSSKIMIFEQEPDWRLPILGGNVPDRFYWKQSLLQFVTFLEAVPKPCFSYC